jgi:hypothetical protein
VYELTLIIIKSVDKKRMAKIPFIAKKKRFTMLIALPKCFSRKYVTHKNAEFIMNGANA